MMHYSSEFSELFNSPLFRRGSLKFDEKTNSFVEYSEVSDGKFFLSFFGCNIITDSLIEKIKSDDYYNPGILPFPDLATGLMTSYVPEKFKKVILNQWTEVKKMFSSMEEQLMPFRSFLSICSEYINISSHIHCNKTKKIVTVIYQYVDKNSDKKNQIIIDNVCYEIPTDKHKILLTIDNNASHAAVIQNGCCFMWVNDFDHSDVIVQNNDVFLISG